MVTFLVFPWLEACLKVFFVLCVVTCYKRGGVVFQASCWLKCQIANDDNPEANASILAGHDWRIWAAAPRDMQNSWPNQKVNRLYWPYSYTLSILPGHTLSLPAAILPVGSFPSLLTWLCEPCSASCGFTRVGSEYYWFLLGQQKLL